MPREETWNRILTRLRQSASPESFENWLEPVACEGVDVNGSLRLRAPNAHARDWIHKEYGGTILSTAQQEGLSVSAVVIDCANGTNREPDAPAPLRGVQQTFEFKDRSARFNPKYTFDSFVVGSCNEFAHAAARAVASTPAKAYNPLYIYGDVGMGKTHLMHAIGQRLLDSYPGMRIVYISSEDFMNEMISSIRYDRMSSFHERFRSADALLVDDIQILGSRERTQEEFFHTFNALHNMQKQIVISSDQLPRQVPGMVERLRSRFAWGLMADIQPPDLETKMAILDRKAEDSGVKLPDQVRSYLATQLKSNIRELEGALVRLLAVSSVSNTDITLAMAKQALRSLVVSNGHKASYGAIMEAVGEHFGLKAHQLREKSNAQAIAYPRQIAMYLSKEILGASLPDIGKAFGGKHHTTVLHAVNKIDRRRASDDDLNSLIHNLTDRFN